MEGGVGGKPVQRSKRRLGGLLPLVLKWGSKRNKKKNPKKEIKRGCKGDPKNHKKTIRAEFLRVLEGS